MTDTARITLQTPIRFDDPLPDAVDTVIIGGGVIGVFTALYLAEAGQSVLLCEKGRVAGEQSSRNWGWIRQQGRDEAELPLMIDALRLWKEVDARLDGACGVRTVGVSYLTTQKSDLARYETWVETARRHGLQSRMLNAGEVVALFGGRARERWIGGVTTPSDARGEPWKAVPAVARLAQSVGVRIAENCAVRRLELAGGQLRGVVTEAGRVACDQVVLAGGAWSSLFLRAHGLNLPQLSVRATALQTHPMSDFAPGNSVDEGLAMRRREDGGYTLALGDRHGFFLGPDALRHLHRYMPLIRDSFAHTDLEPGAPTGFPDSWRTPRGWAAEEETPFERMRVLEPEPVADHIGLMLSRFAERFPSIGTPIVRDSWAGMIDTMPDVVPVIDRAPGLPGLIVATGMSGHGFGIGPGVGRALARMVTGQGPEHGLARFRYARFTDGTRLRRGPSL
ncbi:FAD-binding oxidoreductase [Tropicimonas sp. TH_r6]|uniref:NAD(P)/FAD-dependent oxidoreductase n=1 Tax=Tropicimonas sp. TH_r6 TaxID=3082085 RepID=UPI0029550CBD|nr:FAD-binding oxidoreductase [Tropicimonas sp. TH_r6]MDV7142906.1 FAD-binding oxidoreductase [Tropicimonas sp. TH_r6]